MVNALLQKSASSELWWIAGAFGLFLCGLGVTLLVQHMNNRGRTTPHDTDEESHPDTASDSPPQGS